MHLKVKIHNSKLCKIKSACSMHFKVKNYSSRLCKISSACSMHLKVKIHNSKLCKIMSACSMHLKLKIHNSKLCKIKSTCSMCFNSFITVGRFCGPADPLPLSPDLFTQAPFLSFLGFQRVKMNEEGTVCTLPEFSILCMKYKVSYTVVCRIDVRSQVKSNKRICVHMVTER